MILISMCYSNYWKNFGWMEEGSDQKMKRRLLVEREKPIWYAWATTVTQEAYVWILTLERRMCTQEFLTTSDINSLGLEQSCAWLMNTPQARWHWETPLYNILLSRVKIHTWASLCHSSSPSISNQLVSLNYQPSPHFLVWSLLYSTRSSFNE